MSERDVSNCFGSNGVAEGDATDPTDNSGLSVGDNLVPADLRIGNNLSGAPRRGSGRDSANDILVYWSSDAAERPGAGSACWLYVDRLGVWSQGY